ncbi:MAG: hypothetical protein ACJAXN_002166 [Psychromonas sp.]|jgi:hypothetical protein
MINFSETLSDVNLSLSFDREFKLEDLQIEFGIYVNYLYKIGDVDFSIYENGEWSHDVSSTLDDAVSYINENLLDQADESTSYLIKVSLEKKENGTLHFYSYGDLVSSLDSELKNRLKEVDVLSKKHKELCIFNTDINICFDVDISNNYDSENIFLRYNFETKPQITPEHLYKWGEALEACEKNNIFHSLCVYMTLIVFSNKSKYENEGIYHFFFDGMTSIPLKIDFNKDIQKIKNEVHDLFKWVFEDTGSVAKISIIRNIITVNGFTNIEQAFSKEAIYAIESNHCIYQEDNVKQYFEIKNKVVDFIFDLSNKMSDSYDAYYQSNKINLVAILSYLVTIIVIRGMSRENFEAAIIMFSVISLVFFIVAFIYTTLVQGELSKKVELYEKQKNELLTRYKGMLCEVELDQLFNSPSFNDVKCKSEEAKFHYIVNTILFLFIVADVIFLAVELSLSR